MGKAKKTAGVIENFCINWGDDNLLQEGMDKLGSFILNASGGDEVVFIERHGNGQINVRVGTVVLVIRKPSAAEKKKTGNDYMVVIEEGLDENSVVLGDFAGAKKEVP